MGHTDAEEDAVSGGVCVDDLDKDGIAVVGRVVYCIQHRRCPLKTDRMNAIVSAVRCRFNIVKMSPPLVW